MPNQIQPQPSGKATPFIKRKNETATVPKTLKRPRLSNQSNQPQPHPLPHSSNFDENPLRAKIDELVRERGRLKDIAKASEQQFRDCEVDFERIKAQAVAKREEMNQHEKERNEHMGGIAEIRVKISALQTSIETMKAV